MECFVLLGGGLWGPSSSSSEVDPGGASRFLGAGPPVEVLAVDFVRAIAVKRQEIHACVDRRNQSDAYIRAELFRIPDFSHNTIMHTKKRAYLIHFLLKYLDFNDGLRLVPVYRELAHCHRKIPLSGPQEKTLGTLQDLPAVVWPTSGPSIPGTRPLSPQNCLNWHPSKRTPQDLPAVVWPASGSSMPGTRPLSPQNCLNWPPSKRTLQDLPAVVWPASGLAKIYRRLGRTKPADIEHFENTIIDEILMSARGVKTVEKAFADFLANAGEIHFEEESATWFDLALLNDSVEIDKVCRIVLREYPLISAVDSEGDLASVLNRFFKQNEENGCLEPGQLSQENNKTPEIEDFEANSRRDVPNWADFERVATSSDPVPPMLDKATNDYMDELSFDNSHIWQTPAVIQAFRDVAPPTFLTITIDPSMICSDIDTTSDSTGAVKNLDLETANIPHTDSNLRKFPSELSASLNTVPIQLGKRNQPPVDYSGSSGSALPLNTEPVELGKRNRPPVDYSGNSGPESRKRRRNPVQKPQGSTISEEDKTEGPDSEQRNDISNLIIDLTGDDVGLKMLPVHLNLTTNSQDLWCTEVAAFQEQSKELPSRDTKGHKNHWFH
ncbi:hypothetical protein B0H13DRAFT_1927323 [Mycena leptocephala]|nr:hypothetical protein B0H13DRAFT_1927323 [Mycena leptocephala]